MRYIVAWEQNSLLRHQAMAYRQRKKVVQVLSNVLNSSSKAPFQLATWKRKKSMRLFVFKDDYRFPRGTHNVW